MQNAADKDIYAAFCGPIDQTGVSRIFQAVGTAISQQAPRFHLLLQSNGGMLGDGICIYNYFRAVPIEIVTYNAGSICSAAVYAFLGGKVRKASTYATFMIHRTYMSPQAAKSESLHAFAEAMALDDARSELIIRASVVLTDEQWAIHRITDLWLSAQQAAGSGLATCVGEFSPPIGTVVYTI